MNTPTATKNKEITVAVLPFQLYNNPDEFSPLHLGFTEDLINNFSMFMGLSVISQYSTQHIKDISNEAEIHKLGADYLVTGSFLNLGIDIRIGLQLIRTEDKKVVFSNQYRVKPESLLNAEDTITQQIVSILQEKIDYDLLTFSYKKQTVQLAAYENWLIGMDYLKKCSLEDDQIAREYFEAALKINSKYARAHTGISLSYFNEWSCQLWERWDESHKGAMENARKALELDENDYQALMILGRCYLYTKDFEMAEHCLRKSLKMNPNDSQNLLHVAFWFSFLGYADEAEQYFLRAKKLNPFYNDTYYTYGIQIYFELGNYEKCIEYAKKIDINNYWVDLPAYMAAIYFHLSDMEKVKECWQLYLKRFKAYILKNDADTENAQITKNMDWRTDSFSQKAFEWHVSVNPYRDKTNLKPFWEFISNKLNIHTQPETVKPKEQTEAAFVQVGEMWEMTFQQKTVMLKDAKGFHDLLALLKSPEREIHCMELMGVQASDSQGVEVIDLYAKSNYVKRIKDLQHEIAEAEDMNNYEVLGSLQEEYEQLVDHLTKNLGIDGKPRETGSSIEKARSAVTWRIRSAIKKIESQHPALAKHFSLSVKTGTFCCYQPETPINWQL
ncbi:tetratricopeptide repeat protein [Chondrinema litorale]|uniref:tetratricopeptide repeat protein n=1 Tax=Chondrinema litorale TaxID=2994555 RepID=UPI002543BB3D|nr:tetratricopeptide repeat protein [Chondrinema litorale]UZR99415.1 tetratricopeptide repeat protein [Chondrinema litorale]